jgi:predicted helicase
LLTNYIEFIWIKDGSPLMRETLCYLSDLEKPRLKLDATKEEKVLTLLKNYLSEAPKGIGTAKELAKALAVRSRNLRDFLALELFRQENEHQEGKLWGLYQTFRTNIFHELTLEEFADAFAQMLCYGLFLAKLNADTKEVTLGNAKNFIPQAFELIKELVNFLDELDKDEYAETRWIVEEVISLLNNINLPEIQRSLSFSKDHAKDPYVYFYEDFLSAYDAKLRKAKGVYYTPPPVVNFIVRAINDLLKTEFGITSGLADHKKVTVLDFATGTGTFLLQVFEQIFEAIPAGSKAKRDLIVKEHILKNLYGFEYLIAPYTIAHLKLSQYLKENGYEMNQKERLQIYLTNTLEPINPQTNFLLPALANEGKEAQKIKDKPILVITGNPPYSGHSKNTGDWISKIIKDYYFVDGKPLGEKNPKWLQDDYVKFIRFAQFKMEQVEEGIVGIITNHSFLDNPTFRGMRQSLMKTFDRMYFIDLHGNSKKKEKMPDGGKDENVFDIEQGVAISILIKKKGIDKKIFHADFYGLREEKYLDCLKNDLETLLWTELQSNSPFYLFTPQDNELKDVYYNFKSLKDIFAIFSTGIMTKQDQACIFNTDMELEKFISILVTNETEEAREKLNLGSDTRDWALSRAKGEIIRTNNNEKFHRQINYRLFDYKWTYYTEKSRTFMSYPIWNVGKHFILGENLGLICTRQLATNSFAHSFISDRMIDICFISNKTKEGNYIFPIYQYQEPTRIFSSNGEVLKNENIINVFRSYIEERYQKHYSFEQILGYIYGILHSPTYRTKYAEFLKIDFPRIPFVKEPGTFEKISSLGGQLIKVHLMKTIPGGTEYKNSGAYKGDGNNEVIKPEYRNNKLYISSTQYFDNVSPAIYEFHIGGYQVLYKYLKDRKGRTLTLDEVTNVENIVKVLQFTLLQMEEIDRVTKDWV